MHAIVNADIMIHVEGPLIDIHRRCSRTAKSVRAHVGEWNQRKELLYDGVRHQRALRKGGNSHTGNREPLSLAQPFIAEEEERSVLALVAKHRTALAEMRHV